MKFRKVAIIGTSVAVVAFLAYVVAAPAITMYRIKRAAENNDSATLSELVDFPSVRQSFKEQVNAMIAERLGTDPRMQNSLLAGLGSAAAGIMAERMVETWVTPEGITQLMEGARPRMDATQRMGGAPGVPDTQSTPGGNLPPAETGSGTPGTTFPEADASMPQPAAPQPPRAPAEVRDAVRPRLSMAYQSFNRFVVNVGHDDYGDAQLVLQRHGLGWRLADVVVARQQAKANAAPAGN